MIILSDKLLFAGAMDNIVWLNELSKNLNFEVKWKKNSDDFFNNLKIYGFSKKITQQFLCQKKRVAIKIFFLEKSDTF